VSGRRLVALAPLLLLGPVACGTDVLPAKQVADGAAKALEPQVGVRPDVSCPEDVEQTVGATARCTAGVAGATYGVTVTVTGVDGEDAVYSVEVDDKPAD
jgi:hypothetical protein